MMIEFLRANAGALVTGLYLLGGAGFLAIVWSFAYCVDAPFKTPQQYNRARCVSNIGAAVMIVAPVIVVVLGILAHFS